MERKLDLIKAWTLVRKSYDMGELSNSIWDEVDLSVVLTGASQSSSPLLNLPRLRTSVTALQSRRRPLPCCAVLGTLFLFLLLLTRGGRNLILGAIDTAVASALLVLIGALVFAVPILVLIGILSALVTTLTWLACFVWHVVESPVLFFFQRTSGGEGLETGGPAGGEPVVSHTVIPDAEVVGQ